MNSLDIHGYCRLGIYYKEGCIDELNSVAAQ